MGLDAMTKEQTDSGTWQGEWMLPRREVLKYLAGGLAGGTLGARWSGAIAQETVGSSLGEEAYWEQVKNQFPIRPGLIVMNAANLCPTHYSVLEHAFELTRDLDSDVSIQNRGKFADTKSKSRAILAEYVGAEADEIAITRNTSESNNTIINGLELGPGDEVVIWGENHPSNNIAWEVRARRFGFSVKKVPTPDKGSTPEDLRRHFVDALTSRTRVFAVSHVSNLSGIGLPMKALCLECRDRDIITLVDGAQTLGALSLDLHDLGCDFFTGSLHKWPMGPKEAGLLYVRRGMAETVWPSIVTFGYENAEALGAKKFESLGQRDDPTIAAIVPTVDFHNVIGKERVEARLRVVVERLRAGVAEIPGVSILTPSDPAASAAILVFSLPEISGQTAFERLYRENGVAVAQSPIIDGLRLSPHVYNTLADVDAVLVALRELA
jgi:isopenicillin-N epimerase